MCTSVYIFCKIEECSETIRLPLSKQKIENKVQIIPKSQDDFKILLRNKKLKKRFQILKDR